MATDWDVGKGQRQCATSGKNFEEGDVFYSTLTETDEGFSRNDFSTEVWENTPKGKFFSFWKTKAQAESDKPARLVIDTEAFYMFFCNMGGDDISEKKKIFRYLVALILVRKRVLRIDKIEKDDNGEWMYMFDNRAKQPIRLSTPDVGEEQLLEAQEMLNQIFECNISPEDDME